MRKNLFIRLSNRDLKDCFNSYIRLQNKREDYKGHEVFAKYVDEYIWMLEEELSNYRYYDNNKKYDIGFSIAEKDMIYDMAKRYLKLCDILDEVRPLFKRVYGLKWRIWIQSLSETEIYRTLKF